MMHTLTPLHATTDSPAALVGKPLFASIAAWLTRFTDAGPPALAALNTLRAEVAPATCSGGGAPIRFSAPDPAITSYEAHIFASGEVPTRSHDWHDAFNALAWCAWPRSKACCNRLHVEEIHARSAAGLGGRGPVRDALTQFDECGIVVVSSVPEIPALLAAHEWEEVFWRRRQTLQHSTRFLIFGHGSWDQLRAPFFGLCAKALYRVVAPDWHTLDEPARLADTDAWLAQELNTLRHRLSTRAFSPLPLLGIPGLTPANESADYYADSRQFRPRRQR